LFNDLAGEATSVRLSSHSFAATTSTEILTQAAGQLIGGKSNRLQIRYTWQNKSWIDTLIRTPEGFRLTRIAHAL
jgi:hypothetical protein